MSRGKVPVFINGRFLVQQATGVQRVSREFTLAADRLLEDGAFPDLDLVLIAPKGADFAPLGLRHVRTEHLKGGNGYAWEQVALPLHVGSHTLISLGNSAPLVSLLRGKQVAVMIHDQSYSLFSADYSFAYRMVHKIMDGVILARAMPLLTVSDTEAANIRAGNPSLKVPIVVAANGSWVEDRAVDSRRVENAAPFGLSVGGFSDRKNFDAAFATAVALAEQGIAFRFVGKPSERATRMLAEANDVARARVHYLGFTSDEDLAQMYREASFLLYPSLYEASGLPPSEAMSFGCPVIASDLPVMRERCGDAAIYCAAHDHAAMIAAAICVVNNKAVADDLSRRGVERAARFTWRKQAEIILRAVQSAS